MPTIPGIRWALAPVLLIGSIPALAVGASPAAAGGTLPGCPVSALAKAKGTVDITVWESMTRNNQTTIQNLTNQFNASQSRVHVTLSQQDDYDDTWAKYEDGLSDDELPNVAQLQDTNLAGAVQSQSIVPAQSCIDAAHYSTSDYVSRMLGYWKIGKVQEALPFAVSGPVLYYNKAAFSKAGLNPDDPPATMAALIGDAKQLKTSGTDEGMGLSVQPQYLVESSLATANSLLVNRGNGRAGTASRAVFGNATGLQIYSQLDSLVKNRYAVTNPDNGPSEYDDLLGIGSGKYGMAIDTSAALGTILTLLKSGQYPGTDLGVGPFPALSSRVKGGVQPSGSALYVIKKGSTPAQQAASWEYITFMDSPVSQATWSVGTGYVPVRRSSLDTSTIQTAWKATPQYQVAYDELLDGLSTPATSGAVIGAYPEVTTDETTSLDNMFQEGMSPKKALAGAVSSITSSMQQYNERLGS